MIKGLKQSVAYKKRGKTLKSADVLLKMGGNKKDGIYILIMSIHTEEILVKE